jgi:hypothetical protein
MDVCVLQNVDTTILAYCTYRTKMRGIKGLKLKKIYCYVFLLTNAWNFTVVKHIWSF